ncbi:MAG: nucleoside hydrolase [Armatimonadota bacterium]
MLETCPMAIKMILDTDIGSDVDDAFALALVLASPEIDLIGVSVVHGDLLVRAKMVIKMLQAAGRKDVPVILGESKPLRPGRPVWWAGYEDSVWDLSGVDTSQIIEGATTAYFLEKAAELRSELTIVSIGPTTNIGKFVRDCPEAARSIGMLSIMGGNYVGVRGRSIMPEHNFKCDPEAAELTVNSGCPARMIGINITQQTALTRLWIEELMASETEIGQLLGRAGCHYLGVVGRDQTAMHDSTAVAAVLDPAIFGWKTLGPRVQTEGNEAGVITFKEKPDTGGKMIDVAVEIHLDAFDKLFWRRIRSLAYPNQ